MAWEYVKETTDIVTKLKSENHHIVGVEQTANTTLLQNFENPNKKTALIFGNEVFGVSEEVINLCDECIEIPQFGTKHSLNISVSCGVVVWDGIYYTVLSCTRLEYIQLVLVGLCWDGIWS